MLPAGWHERNVHINELLLDPLNPRIDLSDAANVDVRAIQLQIRSQLFETQDVIKLAASIVRFGGFIPGERLIVLNTQNGYIVLEGNRRVCACQALVDQTTIPELFRNKLNIPRSAALLSAISTFSVVVAPDRESADPVLTQYHTIQQKKPWSPYNKRRRTFNLFEAGLDVESIAVRLNQKESEVRRALRDFKIFRYAQNLQWSPLEREVIRSSKPSAFYRIFQLSDFETAFGTIFDETGEIYDQVDKQDLEILIKQVASDFLIKKAADDGTRFDTRISADDYTKRLPPEIRAKLPLYTRKIKESARNGGEKVTDDQNGQNTKGENNNLRGKSTRTDRTHEDGGSADPKQEWRKPRQAPFFQDLTWTINDNRRLQSLLDELKKVNHVSMPICAGMLLRATLETSLLHQAKKKGLHQEFQRRSHGGQIKFDNLINMCLSNVNVLFDDQGARDCLQQFRNSGFKRYLDWLTHDSWMDPNQEILEAVAAMSRQLIAAIVKP